MGSILHIIHAGKYTAVMQFRQTPAQINHSNRETENVAARHQIRKGDLSGRRRRTFDLRLGPIQLPSEGQGAAAPSVGELNTGWTRESGPLNFKAREHIQVTFVELSLSDDGQRSTQTLEALISGGPA
jgi:hypothetical protein